MATQIKIRRDTAANWTASNPTPAQGEPCLETDTGLGKFGDGATAWSSLPYSWVKDISDKDDAAPAQNPQTGTTYTFAKADAKKLVTASNGSAQTYTVPPQASVAWVAGTVLRVVNLGAGVVTFAAGAGVTVANTTATLGQYDAAQLVRTGSDAWVVVKGGGLPKASVSATTGSPAVDTTTIPGRTIYKWTANGTVTVDRAGLVEVFLIGGGGGGGNGTAEQAGAGGAGGKLYRTAVWLDAGTHDVLIGIGGLVGYSGGPTVLGPFCAAGGGVGGQTRNAKGGDGGCGGGGGDGTGAGGAGRQGGNGGNGGGNPDSGGGGGTSGNASGPSGGAGTSYLGTTYGTGGTRYASTGPAAKTANSGDGGDVNGGGSAGAGASGIAFLVVG
jgi:hypothetical protein